jgi:hypothetical protein
MSTMQKAKRTEKQRFLFQDGLNGENREFAFRFPQYTAVDATIHDLAEKARQAGSEREITAIETKVLNLMRPFADQSLIVSKMQIRGNFRKMYDQETALSYFNEFVLSSWRSLVYQNPTAGDSPDIEITYTDQIVGFLNGLDAIAFTFQGDFTYRQKRANKRRFKNLFIEPARQYLHLISRHLLGKVAAHADLCPAWKNLLAHSGLLETKTYFQDSFCPYIVEVFKNRNRHVCHAETTPVKMDLKTWNKRRDAADSWVNRLSASKPQTTTIGRKIIENHYTVSQELVEHIEDPRGETPFQEIEERSTLDGILRVLTPSERDFIHPILDGTIAERADLASYWKISRPAVFKRLRKIQNKINKFRDFQCFLADH